MKFVKRLLTLLLAVAVLAAGYVVYGGYKMYKEVTDAVPVAEKWKKSAARIIIPSMGN